MATYFVKTGGSDLADGLSDANAFATIGQAQSVAIQGDTIRLNGGDSFAESVSFTVGVTINSYGTGQATIAPSGSTEHALKFTNCGGITVSNVILDGATTGTPNNTTDPDSFRPAGIECLNTSGTTVKYTGVTVTGCEIHGFITGIFLYASGGTTSGYDQVTITDNEIHDCTAFGVLTWSNSGSLAARYTSLNISGNTIHDIPGYVTRVSGVPIAVGFAEGTNAGTDSCTAMIERNLIHTAGSAATNSGGGPGGIILVYSSGVTMQWNEVYGIQSNSGGTDGVALDFDLDCTGCFAQFNYTHDNEDCGVYWFNCGTGNVGRFNLSVNDGQLSTSKAGFRFFGPTGTQHCYNNTIIVNDSLAGANIRIDATATLHFYNNVLICRPGQLNVTWVSGSATLTFEGNLYWTGQGTAINWNGTTYSSLAAWRTAQGVENHGGTPRGFEARPALWLFGDHSNHDDPDTIESIIAYRLLSGTSGEGGGLDLNSLFGVTLPATDMAGDALPASGYSIGCFDAAHVPAQTTYSDAVRMDQPVYYNRPESDASPLVPMIGMDNLTLTGATVVDDGSPPTADSEGVIDADGTDDFGSAQIRFGGAAAISFEMWLWWDAYANDSDALFETDGDLDDAAGGVLCQPNHSGGAFAIGFFDGGTRYKLASVPRTDLPAAEWHHFAAVFDPSLAVGDQVQVWVDGVESTVSWILGPTTNANGTFPTQTLSIFRRGSGIAANFGAGRLQDFAAYPYALTESQIQTHFNAADVGAVPAAPTNYVATAAGSAAIDDAWDDNSDDETGFRVYQSKRV